MNIYEISLTNSWVRLAIREVRIDRNPSTMGHLYDMINKRRNSRAFVMPEWEQKAWAHEISSDMGAWGNVTRNSREIEESIERHRTNHAKSM